MDLNEVQLKPSPRLKANPISKMLYIWVFPFLWEGSKKDFDLSDLYHALPDDGSERLGNYVEKEWDKQLKLSAMQGPEARPRLWKVIRNMIWKRYSLVGIGYCVDELGLRVLQPIVLRNFVKTFSENEDDYPDLKRNQYFYAAALVLISAVHAVLFQTLISVTINLGQKVRLGLSSLIYRKILRLRKADSENTSIGKLCNILSSDVARFDQGFFLLHFFYISPIQMIIYGYLLYNELGFSFLSGLGCLIVFLPFQVVVGRLSMYFRMRIARRTDERGRFLNEIIAGIRLIKMYTWEKPFSSIVAKLRKYEILYIRRGLYLKGTFASLQNICVKLMPFCALITYIAVGNTLTAEKAFFTIAVFAILQTLLNRIPNGASELGEMIASANRIEEFLASKESDSSYKKVHSDEIDGSYGRKMQSKQNNQNGKRHAVEPSVIFKNYSASWTDEQITLKDLNANFTGDKLVMVVGHVGSGKTSFLHAILSELPIILGGHCAVQGRFSYASQEAWIFPASLRQNILFGLEMNEERYWKTIKLCCLQDDLNQFPDGDLTLVGERGVALSGGQKARVNLARAVYENADIYLFDDPLSAVDTKVSKSLFENCIKEYMRGKLRILVTHQLQYMPLADHIVVLNRNGGIWFQGTYEELKKSEVDFTSLISDEYITTTTDIDELLTEKQEVMPDKNENSTKDNGESRNLLTGNIVTGRMKEEEKKIGSVGIRTYTNYFKSGGSYISIVLICFGFIGCQFFSNLLDFWLGRWTNAVVKEVEKNETGSNTNNSISNNEVILFGKSISEEDFYAYFYCGIMAIFIILCIFRSILFFRYCMKISINLHDSMFGSLVRAPVKFFDENPSGRIMNRFTKDLNHIDELLPVSFFDFINVVLALLGMLAINISANYFIAIPAVFMLIALYQTRRFYQGCARNLKRIESISKSPMFTHVTMTAQGLTTIRALRADTRVLSQFERIQDTHTAAFYMLFSTSRWFAIWLELISSAFLGVVSFGFIIISTSSQGGSVGMALTAILSLSGALQWGIRQSAETENYMTSVERTLEYCNLKSEAPLSSTNDDKLQEWPKEGGINFNSVSLSYDDPPKNKVLKEVTFSIKPKEKVGIVGRTGAGKSSLITALFRMTELCDGVINIDDVEIQDLGLHTLRSKISIIPQDPVLFTGTLRYNLDPFDEFTDDELWRVLQEVDLQHAAHSLDFKVADGGSNFSTGQRQLVCLARAILRKNKILLLDEPTANVDPVTDQMVQKTIRTKFADCTILTIAHRLQSVLDCDRILVLDAGQVLEFDKPEVLATKSNGVFSTMLNQIN